MPAQTQTFALIAIAVALWVIWLWGIDVLA